MAKSTPLAFASKGKMAETREKSNHYNPTRLNRAAIANTSKIIPVTLGI